MPVPRLRLPRRHLADLGLVVSRGCGTGANEAIMAAARIVTVRKELFTNGLLRLDMGAGNWSEHIISPRTPNCSRSLARIATAHRAAVSTPDVVATIESGSPSGSGNEPPFETPDLHGKPFSDEYLSVTQCQRRRAVLGQERRVPGPQRVLAADRRFPGRHHHDVIGHERQDVSASFVLSAS